MPDAEQERLLWKRDCAVIAVGLRTMRRPGELGQIKGRHVRDRNGLLEIFIRKSKTDQHAQGRWIPIDPSRNPLTSPDAILREMLEAWGQESDAPIFRSIAGKQLSAQAVSSIVRKRAAQVGLEGRYTGHSLRIGGAVLALQGGMTMAEIRAVGGWKSDAVLRYLRAIEVALGGASEKMGF